MLDHAARGLRFQDDPGAIALFQIVSDLHAGAGCSASLGPELDFGMRLISIDGNAADIHVDGADVQVADGGEVLKDAGANGILVALLFFAADCDRERGERQNCNGECSHKRVGILSLESIAHEKGEQLMELTGRRQARTPYMGLELGRSLRSL